MIQKFIVSIVLTDVLGVGDSLLISAKLKQLLLSRQRNGNMIEF